MRAAGIRELKNNLSRYLRRLKPGQVLAITDRGRVVAELRAPDTPAAAGAPVAQRYAHLVSSGVIRRAREAGDPLADWPSARAVRLPPGSVAALIEEDRG